MTTTTATAHGQLEALLNLHVQLSRPFEVLGDAPEGARVNCSIAAGRFEGPRLRGTLRTLGGEWFTLRRDGVGVLDVRCTLQTDDGALILAEHGGLVDFGETGHADLLSGQLPDRRTAGVAVRYHTAHPAYTWLNRTQVVGWASVDLQEASVDYQLFTLSARPVEPA